MEFLTFAIIVPPAGVSRAAVDERIAREASRAAQLTASGALVRIWRPPLGPGEWKNVALWSAPGELALWDLLDSLPMRPWMTIDVIPLSPHPSDPVSA
jgi:muconolactone D-isomerase